MNRIETTSQEISSFYTIHREVLSPSGVARPHGLSVALHASNEPWEHVSGKYAMNQTERYREIDPHTDSMALYVGGSTVVVVEKSRYGLDLNRDSANMDRVLYATPQHAWGQQVYTEAITDQEVQQAQAYYDRFYADMYSVLEQVQGPAYLLDFHSYNHNRSGLTIGSHAIENILCPQVNIGTQHVDKKWEPQLALFMDAMRDQYIAEKPLQVSRDVRFLGGDFGKWVGANFSNILCLSIEWNKQRTHMDEREYVLRDDDFSDACEAVAAACDVMDAEFCTVTFEFA